MSRYRKATEEYVTETENISTEQSSTYLNRTIIELKDPQIQYKLRIAFINIITWDTN